MIAMAAWQAGALTGLVAALIYAYGVALYSLHARLKDVERELREHHGA